MKCELTNKVTCNQSYFRGLLISVGHIIAEFDSPQEFWEAIEKKKEERRK